MKKTAILVYDQFCNFEISVALEMLAMSEKSVVIFSKGKQSMRSEEGITVLPDEDIAAINCDEFDSLLLPGAMDIRLAIEDEAVLEFIREFANRDLLIGAISIAPILLLKAGVMGKRHFMAGVNKEDLYEEGFTEAELQNMTGWDDNIANPVVEGYIEDGHIITSVSYNFVKWAMACGRAMGLEVYPKSFGVNE